MKEIDTTERLPGARIDCTSALRSSIVLLLDFFEQLEDVDPNEAYDLWLSHVRSLSAILDVLIEMDLKCEMRLREIYFYLPSHIGTVKMKNPLRARDEKRKAGSDDTAYSDFGDVLNSTPEEFD